MGNRAEHIRYKQQLKKGINLNLLIVGINDLGKKTFINTLINQPYYKINSPTIRSSRLNTAESNDSKTTDYFDSSEFSIETNTFEYSPGSIPIKLRVSVTNNFGFNCQPDDSHGDILLSYIENKHRSVLHEEMKINRNPNIQDFRIHLTLYFVQPNIKGLSKFDILMMSKICHRVNLLPIIAKRDGLTNHELSICKKNILKDIMVNNIKIYNFLSNDENNDDGAGDDFMTLSSREYNYLNELDRVVPFSIVGSNTVGENTGAITRVTKWGSINIEDENICDFKLLKSIIFETHLQEFKDVTVEKLYESFRIEQLLKT